MSPSKYYFKSVPTSQKTSMVQRPVS